MRKSLMKDLQNKCEKVIELEIQLEEIKEQQLLNDHTPQTKIQDQRLAFLERNLDQLTLVQKQVFITTNSLIWISW